MPQMSPINWIFMSMFFLLIYYIFLLMIYFYNNLNLKNKKYNMSKKKFKNIW